MNSRTRRRSLLASIALTGTIALTACGTAPQQADNPDLSEGNVEITLNWWGADTRHQMTQQAIDLFEDEHPNITVKPQFADWSGYWDKLATTTAANSAPDVTQFDQIYLSSYADRGALYDLSKLSEQLDTSGLDAGVLDAGKVSGTQYAVPIGVAAAGVIINTTLFEQYGVEIPDGDTWTWEDFDAAALAISEASGGAVHGVSPFGSDSFTFQVWARQHGEDLFDEDGKVVVSPEVAATYWEKVRDQVETGMAPSASQIVENSGVLDQSDIVTGKTAMSFSPGSLFSATQAAAPDFAMKIVNWPTDSDTADGFQYLKPSMYWTVSSKSDHPAEAALLVDFLTTNEEVGKIFRTDRGAPANPDVQAAVAPLLDDNEKQVLEFTDAVSESIGDAPPITPNGGSDLESMISRYNQDVLFDRVTPEDAATDFISQLDAAIETASR